MERPASGARASAGGHAGAGANGGATGSGTDGGRKTAEGADGTTGSGAAGARKIADGADGAGAGMAGMNGVPPVEAPKTGIVAALGGALKTGATDATGATGAAGGGAPNVGAEGGTPPSGVCASHAGTRCEAARS